MSLLYDNLNNVLQPYADKINSHTEKIDELDGSLNTVIDILPTDTVSGEIVSFSDGANNIPVKNLTVDIKPVQSGTGDPSPDNVRPISGWTGAKVVHVGRNLWDEEWEFGNINSSTGGLLNDTRFIRSKNYIPVKPNTLYYSTLADNGYYFGYDYNKNFIGRIYITNAIPSNCFYIKFQTKEAYGTEYKNDISINYPSTNTEYYPYTGGVVEIDWTNEAGTVYGGSLDVTTGLLTVDRKLYTVNAISFSAASYIRSDGVDGYIMNNEIYPNATPFLMPSDLIADKLKYSKERFWNIVGYTNCFTINNKQLHIKISNELLGITDYTEETVATAKEKLNTWLAENPVTLTIPIAETTYQLTAQEVKTILGENNIFADTGDVSVEYRADIKKYIDKVVATAVSALS